MKKMYLLSMVFVSIISALAQSNIAERPNKLKSDFVEPFRRAPYRIVSDSRATLENELINFSYALTAATDSLPLNGYVYLFPDTMARIAYNGTDYSFYRFTDRFMSAGDVLDLSSSIFNSVVAESFDSTTAYNVDSVYIGYYYTQNIENTVDTVRVYVSVEDGIDLKEGTNEEPFPILAYDQANNAPKTYTKAIDILLTTADTAWYGNGYLGVELDIDLEPGQLMSLVVNYIPGYAYSDTSNYFDDLNPFILPCTKELKSTTSHMMSLNLDSDLKFNQGIFSDFYQVYGANSGSGEVWNERYANVYANEYWTKFDGENISTRFNHLDTWYTVSTIESEEDDNSTDDDNSTEDNSDNTDDETTVGIEELNLDMTVYPNPATNQIEVQLSNVDAMIQVYDLIGNLVYQNEAPSLKTTIDLTEWTKGIYVVRVGSNVQKLILE